MMAVRCVVEADRPMPLVRLVGVLDPATAESVRTTLLTGLADGMVVDLSDLTIDEPAALAILSDGIDEAAQWAPGQLLLHGYPGGATAPGEKVPESIARAPARIGAGDRPFILERELDPTVNAARDARQLVIECCARWKLPELAGPACIAVSEMVNNVVAHARTPMTVRAALGDPTLHIAVRDHSPQQPTFRGPVSPDIAGSRGLLLIDTLARCWGSTTLNDGKIVWAVFHPEDEAAK